MNTTRRQADLTLPGTWLRFWLDDPEATAGLQEIAGAAGIDRDVFKRLLAELLELGADALRLRIQDGGLSVIATAWPDVEPAVGEAILLQRVEATGVGAATRLRHTQGYALVRTDGRAPAGAQSATYWLSHPLSGRVLVVDVVVYGESNEPEALSLYDEVASIATWTEDPVDA